MKTLKEYFTKEFLTYVGKWQIGFVVAWPCMYFFADVLGMPYWASIICFQFIGACIFYPIDKWIFNRKNKPKS